MLHFLTLDIIIKSATQVVPKVFLTIHSFFMKTEKVKLILGSFVEMSDVIYYSCGTSCTRQKNA